MDLIHILFLMVIILFFVDFYVQREDLFAPSCIFLAVFLISIFCAILNYSNWNIEYSFFAFFILLTGIITFIIGDLCVYIGAISKKNIYFNRNKMGIKENAKEIKVSSWKIIILMLIQVVALIWNWRIINKIAVFGSHFGGSMLYNYRMITSYSNTLSTSQSVPFVLGQILKVTTASAYVFLFFFSYNVVLCRKKWKSYCYYLLFPMMFVVQTLMSGARSDLLHLTTYTIVVVVILFQYSKNWKFHIRINTMTKLVFLFLVVLVIFYQLSSIVARSDSNRDIFGYLSIYVGGSIQHFNQYIQDHSSINNIFWGQECLANIYRLLWKFKLVDSYPIVHLEVRHLNTVTTGNVYTFFRRLIQDFGYIAMYLITFGISVLFSYIYNFKIKYKTLTYRQVKRICVYAYAMHLIFMASIEQTIFSYLSNSYVNLMIMFILILWFCMKFELTESLKVKVNKGIKLS